MKNIEEMRNANNLFQRYLGDIIDIALLGKALTVTNHELVERDIY